MRISFAFGFILLIAGAAFLGGYVGMSKMETMMAVVIVILMRVAVSLEELIVATYENGIRRFLLTEAQQKEIQRVE